MSEPSFFHPHLSGPIVELWREHFKREYPRSADDYHEDKGADFLDLAYLDSLMAGCVTTYFTNLQSRREPLDEWRHETLKRCYRNLHAILDCGALTGEAQLYFEEWYVLAGAILDDLEQRTRSGEQSP